MKVHWRGQHMDPVPPFHAYVRVGKGSSLGMNFSTLCVKYWSSTVKFGKPKPYPPAKEDCCPACLKEVPRGDERR